MVLYLIHTIFRLFLMNPAHKSITSRHSTRNILLLQIVTKAGFSDWSAKKTPLVPNNFCKNKKKRLFSRIVSKLFDILIIPEIRILEDQFVFAVAVKKTKSFRQRNYDTYESICTQGRSLDVIYKEIAVRTLNPKFASSWWSFSVFSHCSL